MPTASLGGPVRVPLPGAGETRASPVFQDRAAAAQVRLLLRVEQGVPQVHQVEVHVADDRAAQVGVAEIGLADLLGRFEVLLGEVVGVEAGAAPLAGDGAAD